jgi:cation diffusion facilitator family transporter
VGITAIINFVVGYITVRKGRKNNSLALIASGKHLQSDTWSTLGLIIGLILILITGKVWIDGVVAIIFACIILYTGYHILRSSVAGIMDEADKELLKKMLDLLNAHRRENWIDLHNFRIIKYGSTLHIDCHLTIPWYLNVIEAHTEVEELGSLIRKEFGDAIELFVHTDPCLDFSCPICTKEGCTMRKNPFEKRVEWTLTDILADRKHRL